MRYSFIEMNTYPSNIRKKALAVPSHCSSFLAYTVENQTERYVGDEQKFLEWIKERFGYVDRQPYALYQAQAKVKHNEFLLGTNHAFVFMNISIGGEEAGRIVFELFTDLCPKTCENFRLICAGAGDSLSQGLSYANSLIHRVVAGGWIQGGDITGRHGGQGLSIYGPVFPDESYGVKHDKAGILGMASRGPHQNHSQFYITFGPCGYLDGHKVAFGRVVDGMRVVRVIGKLETANERPAKDVVITECGVFSPLTKHMRTEPGRSSLAAA